MFENFEIEKTLCGRFPLVLVDRVEELTAEYALGWRNLPLEEIALYEHYPDKPYFPAVFMLEACVQLIHIMVMKELDSDKSVKLLYASVSKMKFYKILTLGTLMKIEVHKKATMDQMITCDAEIFSDGEKVFSATITMIIR